MAKKKVNRQHEDLEKENPQDQSHQDPIQNLKYLNSILVKETVERRQQVERLVQAKDALERELERFSLEKSELESELTRACEERVCLEIEKLLFCVFVETQVGEMGFYFEGLGLEKREREEEVGLLKSVVEGLRMSLESERERLGRVFRERDLANSDLDHWIKEADGLRVQVSELERNERKNEEEIRELKMKYGLLVMQKKDAEKAVEEIRNVRDLSEKNLAERVKEIELLNGVVEGIEKEKKEVEAERDWQKVKIGDLEKEIRELNEILLGLRKEEGVLKGAILELEKCCSEATEKERVVAVEIGSLMKDKMEMERTIERLEEEKVWGEKELKFFEIEMDGKNELVEKLLREKEENEGAKAMKDNVIVELNKEVDSLRVDVLALTESIKDQEDKSTRLESEVSHYKDAFEHIQLERDRIQRTMDEEKVSFLNLRSTVLEMEKGIQETARELAKMCNENDSLIKEKKEKENQIHLLKEENNSVQKSLLEAQQEINDLRTKMESASTISQRALTMLKDIAASVCESRNEKEHVTATEKMLDFEIEPYAMELEAIRNAFKHKEAVVEDMKQQVECLANSVEDANRKKSFMTILSSATTVFAAILFAYAARVR